MGRSARVSGGRSRRTGCADAGGHALTAAPTEQVTARETARHRGGPFQGEERDALFLSSVSIYGGSALRGRAVAGAQAEQGQRRPNRGGGQRPGGRAGPAERHA